MTRTGYSCASMKRKAKHSCPLSEEHYCSETGKLIDPMSCHKNCRLFAPLSARYDRKKRETEVELL